MTTMRPEQMLEHLRTGPTLVSQVEWHDRVASTNAEVARRAADGAPEGLLVVADEQFAGRGRQGRRWHAPAGTSLMASLLLRPQRDLEHVALLPLLTGLAVLEAAQAVTSARHAQDTAARFALKWPNDLLVGDRKCAGILVEVPAVGVVVIGVGVNVDWRAVSRPPDVRHAVSLAEVAGDDVDRWDLLRRLVERFDHHYDRWLTDPIAVLPAYRDRCATIGRPVRVERRAGDSVLGTATAVTDDGALQLDVDGARCTVRAGDVHHLRHR